MAELKPCPFCGGKVIIVCIGGGYFWKHDGFFNAFDTDCPIRWNHKYETESEAIEAWNRRADDEELEFTRGFIHDNGLDFALASAWTRRVSE